MKGKDTLLLSSIIFICISIGLLSEVFNSNDLFYELGWGDLQYTKVQFQNYKLKKIGGKTITYEVILKVLAPKNENLEIKVNINSHEYFILQEKEKYNEIEEEGEALALAYNAKHLTNEWTMKGIKETKPLRYTKKGDTLLIHHSGNITFPYTVQNITQKSMLVEKQGGNRLNGNLLVLGVSVLMLLSSLYFLYAISKSKQNNKPTK